MTLKVVTFGCRLNSYESELIKKSATDAGLTDTVIFNSCAVTSEAERQLRQAIRKEKRNNPNAKLIITGCAAQVNAQKYASMPEVDKVIGNTEKTKTDSYLSLGETEKVLVNDIMSVTETAPQFIDSFDGRARAFMQVQTGCNHRCTFCIIPYGRGNSRSVPIGEIVLQAQLLVDAGFKEIVITGVDITGYGLDLPGTPSLAQMILRLLNNVPKLQRLRFSSIDVAEIDDELLDLIVKEPRIMPHLHLSLQSGDNMILKRMKRRHNRQQIIDFCDKVRKLRPDVVFGADIIAGFPTEDDEMFQNTFNIVDEANLTYLHVFPYSERDGTPASRMPQVEKHIRKERAKILRKKGEEKIAQHYQSQIGKRLSVLVEASNIGRSEDFSAVKLENVSEGDLLEVTVTSASSNMLYV
ncbi:MAG: tRNA (N(6)-L-threonylcarbamoyladenosine(37)-C(2))-methylthiotransferase MtaB [Alphaproteobacteria bacterium]